jgi:hypothetical protein
MKKITAPAVAVAIQNHVKTSMRDCQTRIRRPVESGSTATREDGSMVQLTLNSGNTTRTPLAKPYRRSGEQHAPPRTRGTAPPPLRPRTAASAPDRRAGDSTEQELRVGDFQASTSAANSGRAGGARAVPRDGRGVRGGAVALAGARPSSLSARSRERREINRRAREAQRASQGPSCGTSASRARPPPRARTRRTSRLAPRR